VKLIIEVPVPLGTVHLVQPPFDCTTEHCEILVPKNAVVDLRADPQPGVLVHWVDLRWDETQPARHVAAGAGTTVVAVFARLEPPGGFAIRVEATGAGLGAITSSPPGINCRTRLSVCLASFAPGTSVVLHATPGAGSRFVRWSGRCAGTADCVLSANPAGPVGAQFARQPARIRFDVSVLSEVGNGADAPVGIDRQGRLAGSLSGPAFPFQRAWFYDGAVRVLDTGQLRAVAAATAGGRVVGSTFRYDDPGCGNFKQGHFCPPQAFLYSGGTLTDLGSLGPGATAALGINERGHVAGYSARRAFLWDGRMRDLGSLRPGGFSAAYGINDFDVAAGYSEVSPDGFHAAVFAAGGVKDLGVLPGGKLSAATAINAAGVVVGWSEVPIPGKGYPGRRAFLYANGSMRDPGALAEDPGGVVELSAINAAGQAVGQDGTLARWRAVLWDEGALSDLNALVDEPELFIFDARAINDRGQIGAVGYVVPTGIWRALLLTPR
jgi:probable HAF family extracellular repeat protein